jgi:hypothetical protein|tara:strand:- start:66 stop:263 length:198 start_codon:yes stop_codon:yes gene_type:complete
MEMTKNNWDLAKLIDYQDNEVYINKNHVTKIHQISHDIIEIELINNSIVYIKDTNINLLIDKLST